MNRRHHYNRQIGLLRMNAFKQRNAVDILHHDVGEDQVEVVQTQDFQGFTAAGCEPYLKPLLLQRKAHH